MRTFGYVTLAFQATGAPDSGPGGIDFVRLIADANWLSKSVLLILLLFSAVSWGIILYKVWQYRARRARYRDVPPGLPQEHQVFRGAVDLRERGEESARRDLPGGLRRAQHAAPPSAVEGRPASRRRIQAAGRRGASYLEKPRRGRPGAAARDERGSEQAREAGAVSRDDREHHAVHRAVRDGVGDHLRVPEHRHRGVDEPERRRPRHRGRAGRDRRRPLRRGAGGVLL